jgi:hypothetical protein
MEVYGDNKVFLDFFGTKVTKPYLCKKIEL